ncbi:MAG: peptidoglycan DD-metalloendopeptidase family protein [Bacilli bacterium]|nr:peptidoglycan DD-metalloendopeptidase family protein [Bacilli bacterium]
MSWNVKTNAEEYKIDTDGLSDKLNILINVSKIDLEELKAKLDSTGYASLATLADGSSVAFPDKVTRTKDKITKLQEALNKLIDKAQYHSDNITAFESGQPVTIEEASSTATPTPSSETITIQKGDTLWNLAISKGHEGSEWNKVFKTKDGQTITSQQAIALSAGDEIMYVGNNQETTSKIAYTTIDPTALTSVAALEAIPLVDYNKLPKNVPSDLFVTTYGGYDDLERPFSNPRMVITDHANGYYSDGDKHWGSDWNSLDGGSTDHGESITPIASGIVVEKGTNKYEGLGYYVTILSEHVNPETGETEYMLTSYGHMDDVSDLKVGQVVTTDTVMGEVGKSGNSDGYHCHVETEMHLQPNERYNKNFVKVSNGSTYTIDEIETEVREDGNTYVTEESMQKLYGKDAMFERQAYSSELSGHFYRNPEDYDKYMAENNINYQYPEWFKEAQ